MTAAHTATMRPEDSGGPASPLSAVVMRDIRKSFGAVEVLHGVDFDVLPGEVHVLAGENGAGKSTLIKILSGVYSDFSGDLQVQGTSQRFRHPSQAAHAGVTTIHQELSLVPTMSISDNLFLGRERRGAWGWVDFRSQERDAARILGETELDATPGQLVSELPIAGQQILEIARALAREAAVVVFDEPTSALNENEVEALFGRIRELKRGGCGVVYITHKMEEIYRLADRITVLRDGMVVGTAAAADLPPDELVRWMVGRELAEKGEATSPTSETSALEVENLRVAHPRIRELTVVSGVTFRLQKGEILGLAGLQGSGKSELLHALFGALGDRVSGEVTLGGNPFLMRSPKKSVEEGLALLTNDRKSFGLAPDQSIAHSVSLASLSRFSGRGGWIRQGEERAEVARSTSEVRLNAPSLDAPVRVLSGGNQQKAYLARCLLAEPKVLLLDEPTRGIDVGAKADIYQLMRNWARRGVGILLTTSEMEEILTLSDRIIVLHRGRVVAEFTPETASKDGILAAAMGHGGFRESSVEGDNREFCGPGADRKPKENG
ncbi:MAG: sugar ABC transporter ATP-binding protein [Gemmatimonadota bacterium]